MSLLAATDLTLRVGRRLLCERLTVALEAGQRWAILGPNGAGKTTLLHTLGGLRAADDGTVRLRGRRLADYGARERARLIGLLFQDSEAGFPVTVLELALSGRHPHLGRFAWEGEQDIARARAALAQVGLEALGERLTTTLSGGERRRAEIAALLTQEAAVWLLDEPTIHLDLPHQAEALALACAHAEGGGLSVFVLHELNLALRYATHAILLFGDGRWQAGPLDEIASRSAFESLYGCRLLELDGGGRPYFVGA